MDTTEDTAPPCEQEVPVEASPVPDEPYILPLSFPIRAYQTYALQTFDPVARSQIMTYDCWNHDYGAAAQWLCDFKMKMFRGKRAMHPALRVFRRVMHEYQRRTTNGDAWQRHVAVSEWPLAAPGTVTATYQFDTNAVVGDIEYSAFSQMKEVYDVYPGIEYRVGFNVHEATFPVPVIQFFVNIHYPQDIATMLTDMMDETRPGKCYSVAVICTPEPDVTLDDDAHPIDDQAALDDRVVGALAAWQDGTFTRGGVPQSVASVARVAFACFQELPLPTPVVSVATLVHLRDLTITRCDHVRAVGALPPALRALTLVDCPQLTNVADNQLAATQSLLYITSSNTGPWVTAATTWPPFLRKLSLTNVSQLTAIPPLPPTLVSFTLDSCAGAQIPPNLGTLPALQHLCLTYLPQLRIIPDGRYNRLHSVYVIAGNDNLQLPLPRGVMRVIEAALDPENYTAPHVPFRWGHSGMPLQYAVEQAARMNRQNRMALKTMAMCMNRRPNLSAKNEIVHMVAQFMRRASVM
jgi:hypothetical protein